MYLFEVQKNQHFIRKWWIALFGMELAAVQSHIKRGQSTYSFFFLLCEMARQLGAASSVMMVL